MGPIAFGTDFFQIIHQSLPHLYNSIGHHLYLFKILGLISWIREDSFSNFRTEFGGITPGMPANNLD